MKVSIGLADDQQLFLKSLGTLIDTFSSFQVTMDALNGEELLRKLATKTEPPEILLIDVNMPVMDGITTVQQVAAKYPLIRLVALSMNDDDATVIRMLKAGCCAYLLKDIHPNELEKALEQIHAEGYYNADTCNINYRRLIRHADNMSETKLSDKEKRFLQLACSDLTYKQIAAQMFLSERTIDGYRESIFAKMKVASRVGMALEAIRRNLVHL